MPNEKPPLRIPGNWFYHFFAMQFFWKHSLIFTLAVTWKSGEGKVHILRP